MKKIFASLACTFAIVACHQDSTHHPEGIGGPGGGVGAGGVTGTVTVHLSDPSSCKVPYGDFNHVWVTITRVRAHVNSDAEDGEDGWVELADLTANPAQIDLLDESSTDCFLNTLGVESGLPAENYQQIRLYLLSNTPDPGEALPASNACGANGFNCVDHQVDGVQTLVLNSQAKTGLKIPPGQIDGGAIDLAGGADADINIDFDACSSIHKVGNGSYHLKPTLHAGTVSLSDNFISGRVVDSVTATPILGGTIFVAAEQEDGNGIDRKIMQTAVNNATGEFRICPLPVGDYDIVVSGIGSSNNAYFTTVTFHVPAGSSMGDIPLIPQISPNNALAQIDGTITTSSTPGATSADLAVHPLQELNGPSGNILVTIPALPNSVTLVQTNGGPSCPAGTGCADYALFVPAGNASVGTFHQGGTSYGAPANGGVAYSVNAQAYFPGTGTEICAPSSLTTNLDSVASPLQVTSGATVGAETLNFTGCE